ncbi:MAG: gamma-glutamyltransferase [Flavobacteriaceae bacterium]|nr:gamma-glutamyltransferase [Flavobacteriaceae bacterium]
MTRSLYSWLAIAIVASCHAPVEQPQSAVVSARAEASKIGIDILKKGGNAFDAMIATHLALTVCYPNAGNIGGGGFLIYRKADGTVGSLDYREKAPAAADRDMYLDTTGNVIPDKSTLGGLAVGVPGSVAGLTDIHEKLGFLPFKDLVQPAIELAEKGYVVTEKQARSFASKREQFILINGKNTRYAYPYQAGDTVFNPELASALKRIQAHGRAGFYQGETADQIVETVAATGGIITHDDLKNYQAIWRDPLRFSYKDLSLVSMAPPSSGGVCLAQMMGMIEDYDIGQYGHNSPEAMQVMIEAERRSYADRSEFLGDPDFVSIPIDSLMDKNYLKERMLDFSWDQATLSSAIKPGGIVWNESDETTHYSILDKDGNAVSVTTTLNGSYGSKVYVEGSGFFLNNEMDDFSSKPGTPNMFGLVGSKANAIAPGKRMLSSMTPTIVEKNGKLSMIVGTPGGSTIITSVFQTILNAYEFKMEMQAAVEAPRFHHQWLPDVVVLEPNRFTQAQIQPLQEKNYNIEEKLTRIIGRVDAIMIAEDGAISTGADPRGDDAAAVW